jgi:hypothetical protein
MQPVYKFLCYKQLVQALVPLHGINSKCLKEIVNSL